MSFDGYYQILCKNGHLHHADMFDYEYWSCWYCKYGIVWSNLVDQTNTNGDEFVVKLEKLTTQKACTCSCGHIHTTGPPSTYKIPSSD